MTDKIDVTVLAAGGSLPQGLPDPVADKLIPYLPVHGRIILIARRQGRIAGLLVALRRPTARMLRITWMWPQDERDIDQALAGRLAAYSGDNGIRVWRIAGSADVTEAQRLMLGLPAPAPDKDYAERWLGNDDPRPERRVPLYTQTTEFTCGPSSLAMSFAGLDGMTRPDRHLEVALWREATTVFGLTGPGGCDPYGVALAARKRGFATRLFMSTEEPVLLDRGNTEAKRDLMRFVQADFKTQAIEAGIAIEQRAFAIEEIAEAVAGGAIAILLIDQMETHGHHAPHWVVAHHLDDGVFFVNDPWIERDAFETDADARDLPIDRETLDRMAWYGEPRYRSALILSSP